MGLFNTNWPKHQTAHERLTVKHDEEIKELQAQLNTLRLQTFKGLSKAGYQFKNGRWVVKENI